MALDLAREALVFTQLRRASRAARRSRVLQPLRGIYPMLVLNRGLVAFLRRHELIWAGMFKLLGREVTGRYEMGFLEVRDYVEEAVKTVREATRNTAIANLPQWLIEELLVIYFGKLPHYAVLEFFGKVERRFREYMEAPQVLKGLKKARTRFQELLSTSQIIALKARRCRYEVDIGNVLYELLAKGVIPVDYSLNSVIVARKTRRQKGSERFWLSTLNIDPLQVLRGFESECLEVVEDVKLEFEERDVGWGLKTTS